MSEKTVFISYRRDTAGKYFARSIKDALTHLGYDVFLDVDCLDAGKWATQILTQVPNRSHFLLLLTPGALDRCTQEDDWVRKEFIAAVQSSRNIVPVREESVELGQASKCCPECLKKLFDYQIPTIQHSSFAKDIKTLTEQFIPPHKAPSAAIAPEASACRFHADISRITDYAPAELIGRNDELKLLSDAWDKATRDESQRPNILAFIAFGGEGKTSLVAKWLTELAHQGWLKCDAAFAWSFYHQGTDEKTADSSDLFLKEALLFFGDSTMANSAQGAFEKGRRLAQLVGAQRAVLILDGLEPLQYPPTSPMRGEFKDLGISALLKGLATDNHGLCVVTTRYSMSELRAFWQTSAPEKELPGLSKEEGINLLQKLGVREESGARSDFEKLVEDVKGHALTLNLLGTFLRDAHDGDIRKRDLVKFEEADAEEQGGHAFRVMDAYVRWLDSEGEQGERALAILELLGLFDRPASVDCIAALQQAPEIPELTEPFVGMTKPQFNMAIARLEAAKLLIINRSQIGVLLSLDAHPLLREYFAHQLQTVKPDAWRAAHLRLYNHLYTTTLDKAQPTLEDLQPLYQAVAHGCQAQHYRPTFKSVLLERILKGTFGPSAFFATKKLGAYGSQLSAVACFFNDLWSKPTEILRTEDQAWILNEAGCCLRTLGRLNEAVEPLQESLRIRCGVRAWDQAAVTAAHLSEIHQILGNLTSAFSSAEAAVGFSLRDREDETSPKKARWYRRRDNTALLAIMHHQLGQGDAAHDMFVRAERIQSKMRHKLPPLERPRLYGIQGFQYCNFLLSSVERMAWRKFLQLDEATIPKSDLDNQPSCLISMCDDVKKRARESIQIVSGDFRNPTSIALDHLTLGRVALFENLLNQKPLEDAHQFLSSVVEEFRQAAESPHLPRALLTRGLFRFLAGARTGRESAQSDLDEAWEIAERGPMKLHLADIYLHRARLFFKETNYPWNKNRDGSPRAPADDIIDAEKLIADCGYHRRDEELIDAKKAIQGK